MDYLDKIDIYKDRIRMFHMKDAISRPSMIATAIELTAVGMTSNTPVSGRFTIRSVLVTQDNAMDFYYADSPFWYCIESRRSLNEHALPHQSGRRIDKGPSRCFWESMLERPASKRY